MQRRYGTVMLGAALLGVGALLFVAAERGAPAQWLMRFWPLFLVLVAASIAVENAPGAVKLAQLRDVDKR